MQKQIDPLGMEVRQEAQQIRKGPTHRSIDQAATTPMEHHRGTIPTVPPHDHAGISWTPPDLGDRGSRERDRALMCSDVL
jgi:hypothetical protein